LTRIDPAKSAETEFMTTRRGFRLATSIGGTLTGRGGDILILDDPMKSDDANSETSRLHCQQWHGNTLLSRLDDKVNGTIILVMQRLHVDDLAGYLMQQGGWDILELPAISEVEHVIPIGRNRFHHRAIGDVLHPEREPREALDRLKVGMGSYNFTAQYQQAPVPPGGNMIKWEWFNFFSDPPPLSDGAKIVQSWDTAWTTSELASYSVGITVLIDKTGTIWVLDLVRGRWQFPDLQREIIKAAHCHRPKCILIEDHASGIGLQQTLKRQGFPIIPIKPKGDKVMRMHAHTVPLEAGKVFLHKGATWLDELRSEMLTFPHGKHDDQVDAFSQLMTWNERPKRSHSIKTLW
jgi:predicted phage terminase large subunit-like protein